MRIPVLLASALLLGACDQHGSDDSANNISLSAAGANAAAPAQAPKARYCFFKEKETKAWAASRDASGNVVVSGTVYRSDPRYKALLGQASVNGTTAEISPSITVNDTGFASPGNWWDVKATIPDSSAVDTVKVTCGAGTIASLSVRRAK